MPIGGAVTNFPQGFASGMSVRGMPLLQMQPGNVFWVNNSSVLNANAKGGSNSNRGTYLAPFSTLQYALDSCRAGRGDIIFVGAGHAETIADATTLSLNKAGVAIVGLGSGSLRPTFTFTQPRRPISLSLRRTSRSRIACSWLISRMWPVS